MTAQEVDFETYPLRVGGGPAQINFPSKTLSTDSVHQFWRDRSA